MEKGKEQEEEDDEDKDEDTCIWRHVGQDEGPRTLPRVREEQEDLTTLDIV